MLFGKYLKPIPMPATAKEAINNNASVANFPNLPSILPSQDCSNPTTNEATAEKPARVGKSNQFMSIYFVNHYLF